MVTSKFYDTELDDLSFKIALKSIGEDPQSKRKGLPKLKEKLLNTNNLESRLDTEFLLRFLRAAKFDVNKAYDRLCSYYQARRKYPELFDTFYPSATPTAHQVRYLWASPMRAEDHSAVVLIKRGMLNPSTTIYEQILILNLLIMDYVGENAVTQLCGVTVILDFNGYGFQHFLQDTPRRLQMALYSFQNTFPMRFRDIHIINAPPILSLLINLAYPFLSKKMRNRLHFHVDKQSLLSLLPADIIPEEYGGMVPNSDLVDLVGHVIHKEEYYRDQMQYGYRNNN